MNNLATFYNSQGNYKLSQLLHERSLRISRKVLGENSPDIFQSINNLAQNYKSQGKYSLSETLVKQAIKSSKKKFRSRSP